MLACLISSITIAQNWNFSNWPISPGIGNGDGSANNPAFPVISNGLALTGLSTNVNMGQIEASAKSFGTTNYTNRFKFNGGGYPGAAAGQTTPSVSGTDYFTPTQRFISLNVSGNSTISAVAITGSNGSERILFVTDGQKLIGSMVVASDATVINQYTVEYTGDATKLYLFCNASINLYELSATNYIPTSLKTVQSGNVIHTEFFNLTGTLVCTKYADLKPGIYLQKSTFDTGKTTTVKISKARQ